MCFIRKKNEYLSYRFPNTVHKCLYEISEKDLWKLEVPKGKMDLLQRPSGSKYKIKITLNCDKAPSIKRIGGDRLLNGICLL